MPNFYKYIRFNGVFEVETTKDSLSLINNGGVIENEIFWNGLFKTWENEIGWLWLELSQSCKTIMDIGANIGVYSLVAKKINTQSTVYSFEPSKSTFEILQKNILLNNMNINTVQVALSDKNGSQTFYDIIERNQSAASLNPEMIKGNTFYQGKMKTIEYDVKTQSAFSFIEENDLDSIDLIKLDVEMYEPEVIQGFGKYLVQFKPVIIIEVLNQNIADRLNSMIEVKDYLVFSLCSERKVQQLDKFCDMESKGVTNFIFFHKDKTEFIQKKHIPL